VLVALIVLAVALPAELALLQALATPDPKDAVRAWVGSLDAPTLEAVVADIKQYPVLYRREVLRVLTPERRAGVWQSHIRAYVDEHPDLDSSSRVLLEAAIAFATPSVFGSASAADRAQMQALADQAVALLGRDEAEYLFYRLGPKDTTFASLEPLTMRLTNWMRGLAIAIAEDVVDCDCNSGFGCEGALSVCRTNVTCTIDDEWPACGWFWNQTCDGLCGPPTPQG
jgi:hypothetical protein